MISLAFADTQAPVSAAASSPFVSLMPLLVIFVIFYFLLIRPQQKKMKVHKEMLSDLKKGDMIITSSGIYGVVVGIGENSIEVKLAENVRVKMLKSAVSEKLNSQDPAETKLQKLEAEKK
jgi:preprotein translocase subunit YajC